MIYTIKLKSLPVGALAGGTCGDKYNNKWRVKSIDKAQGIAKIIKLGRSCDSSPYQINWKNESSGMKRKHNETVS